MMYKKGTRIEVLDKKEVPSGIWKLAEIISSNKQACLVKYDSFNPGENEPEERIPKKFIRPRQPERKGPIEMETGEIVEVLDRTSWKLAEFISGFGISYANDRLLGSFQLITVQKSDLRLRHCWVKKKWIAIGKDVIVPPQLENDQSLAKGKKRGLQSRPGICKKIKRTVDVDFGLTRIVKLDEDSVCSSSGSNELGIRIHSSADREHLSDDASSPSSPCSCSKKLGKRESSSTTVDMAERVHRLELDAYRATMEAFFSSGSLTWEQEEIMTNLRLELHISNDEHLSELRYLSSQSL